ncbi:MAG TPA: hypothetical protein VHD76_20420 [Bryobacteraceae bacterium]|jgi:hypothetical protein|nr:hypothetical protein [Bryobacteraceae bacterium]
MNERNDSAAAYEGMPAKACGEPPAPRLDLTVIAASPAAALAILRKARALADRLHARITIVAPQIVPYPLPLERPEVPVGFNERKFRAIEADSPPGTTVKIYLCRDRLEMLQAVLAPRSLVMIGHSKRLWPGWEESLAKQLCRAGHEVVVTETE